MIGLGLKPSYRVNRALGRLTRDRWICGAEIYDVAIRLARCACFSRSAVGNVLANACRGECFHIGMLRGEPVAYTFDDDYGDACRFLGKIKVTPSKPKAEVWILGFIIRRLRRGR